VIFLLIVLTILCAVTALCLAGATLEALTDGDVLAAIYLACTSSLAGYGAYYFAPSGPDVATLEHTPVPLGLLNAPQPETASLGGLGGVVICRFVSS
jgi:hypothetical protein